MITVGKLIGELNAADKAKVDEPLSMLPKSVHVDRMEQNFDIWDFTLTDDDMAVISAKDKGHSEIVDHSSAEFVKFINGLKV